MFQVVDADTADAVWQQVAKWFLAAGLAAPQTGRGGNTKEVLHAALSIRDPRQRWVASRFPALNPAFAIAEVVWIVCGRQDSQFLNYFNPGLPKFAGEGPTYRGAYGFRLRRHFGIDQLERAYRALVSNSDSRQVALQIWDSKADLPNEDGTPLHANVPCNIVAFLKVRDARLEWTQVMRSNDLFLGLPHNIVQFTSLQEVFAGWLGIEPGTYNHISDSLHLYEKDGSVDERLRPIDVPRNTDSLALAKGESDRVFHLLSGFGDLLLTSTNGPDEIRNALQQMDISAPYLNLATILAAEALRRRGQLDLAKETNSQCSNYCLKFLFDRWLERVSDKLESPK
jgi:thymidylate synthase